MAPVPAIWSDPERSTPWGAQSAVARAQKESVCHALMGARELVSWLSVLVRPGEEVLILSDSHITICTTTGAWA